MKYKKDGISVNHILDNYVHKSDFVLKWLREK